MPIILRTVLGIRDHLEMAPLSYIPHILQTSQLHVTTCQLTWNICLLGNKTFNTCMTYDFFVF